MQFDRFGWRTSALLLMWVASAWAPATADAGPGAPTSAGRVELELGDYRFTPQHVEVKAGSPVTLVLRNQDSLTPHNFTLQDTPGDLDIDTDVPAGQEVTIEFTPRVAGSYTFFCDKKLPFMKSHRERGMEGTLTVTPAR